MGLEDGESTHDIERKVVAAQVFGDFVVDRDFVRELDGLAKS